MKHVDADWNSRQNGRNTAERACFCRMRVHYIGLLAAQKGHHPHERCEIVPPVETATHSADAINSNSLLLREILHARFARSNITGKHSNFVPSSPQTVCSG
jgi:hypothetical protein